MTDWVRIIEEGRRRFAAMLAAQPAVPEPTAAEAARITVARGRVQAEHDDVLAQVGRLYAHEVTLDADEVERVAVALDAIDEIMPMVDGGTAYGLYAHLAELRDALGLPGLMRYPGGA